MQEICNSNPPVVIAVYDPNKARAGHHQSSKLGSKLKYLDKGVYPFEYMDDLENFNEALLPEKEDFYSHLNMEDITDEDYVHGKRVFWKDFEIKNWNEY